MAKKGNYKGELDKLNEKRPGCLSVYLFDLDLALLVNVHVVHSLKDLFGGERYFLCPLRVKSYTHQG